MLKKISSFVGVTIFERLASFFITAFCVQKLSKEEYALFGLVLLTLSLFSSFIDAGHNGWLRTVYLKAQANYRRAFFNAFRASTVLFLFSCLFLILVVSEYLNLANRQILLGLIWLMMFYADQLIAAVLITRQDIKNYRNFRFITVCFGFFCFFFIQYLLPTSDLLTVRLLGLILSALIAVSIYRKVFLFDIDGGSKHLPIITFKEQLKFVLPLLIGGFAVNSVLILDRWIIEISGNTLLLAEILVVFTLIMPVSLIADVLGKQLMPRFMLYLKEGKTKKLAREQMIIITFIFMISLGISLLGYPIIGIYAGHKYQTESVQFLVWGLAFYPLLKIVYQFQGRVFMFYEKTVYLMTIPLSAGVVYLAILYQMKENLDFAIYIKLFMLFAISTSILTFVARLIFLRKVVK